MKKCLEKYEMLDWGGNNRGEIYFYCNISVLILILCEDWVDRNESELVAVMILTPTETYPFDIP